MVTGANAYGPRVPGALEDAAAVQAEAEVLATPSGRELLKLVTAERVPRVRRVAQLRRSYPAEHVAAAMRLGWARVGARGKIDNPDGLWLETVGVEQATADGVARHKAGRFAGSGAAWAWDLCCGLGIDATALAGAGVGVVAVDASQAACRRALWNARARGVGDRLVAVRGRAEDVRPGPGDWVHIDPDRRASAGRDRESRARSIEDYSPGVETLRRLIRSGASGAIKLSPASDFARVFAGEDVEVEIVSLGGECKEATVWFGAARTCERRATCLPSGATWAGRDGTGRGQRVEEPVPGHFVFDPDPSLERAGLLDAFAEAFGLARVAPRADWLTGRARVDSPLVRAFRVIDVLPADHRRVHQAMLGMDLRVQEVRIRGLQRTPEELRRSLHAKGSRGVTVFFFGGGRGVRGRAILAEPVDQAIAVGSRSPE